MHLESSPFAFCLRTNYALSDNEKIVMDELLSEPLRVLSKIEQQITELQLKLDILLKERDTHLDFINEHRALSSPIRRLPPDLLGDIFVNCLPTQHEAIINTDECPLVLTQICSGWRALALRTPRLWSSIHIVTRTRVERRNACLEVVKMWLKRSGDCPLSLSLSITYDNSSEQDDGLVDLVLSLSKRWLNLSISGTGKQLSNFAKVLPCDAPYLTGLAIAHTDSPDDYDSDDDELQLDIWTSSSLLRGTTIRRLSASYISENLNMAPITWSVLTELTIRDGNGDEEDYPTLNHLRAILNLCMRLEKCEILVADARSLDDETSKISLPYLHTLSLYFAYLPIDVSVKGQHFFASLEVSALKYFSFGAAGSTQGLYSKAIIPFLLRTGLTLESLTTHPKMLDDREAICDSLRRCPNLRKFIVDQDLPTKFGHGSDQRDKLGHIFSDDILTFLCHVDETSNHYPCPRLETLQLHFQTNTFSDDNILSMLGRRAIPSAHGKQLKSLSISFGRVQQRSMVQEITAYQNAGLEVNLFYQQPKRNKFSRKKLLHRQPAVASPLT